MARRKGNFDYNYPKVIKFLHDKGIQYDELSGGQHLKIFGDVAYIDLWPSRMTYHIIQTEGVDRTDYPRLSFYFKEKELMDVLNGKR